VEDVMGQTKTSGLWVLLAFLLGVSFFGMYKSLQLLKKNVDLNQSLNGAKLELAETQISLKQTEDHLRESDIRNAELKKDVQTVTVRLAKAEEGLFTYQKKLEQLNVKFREVAESNASLEAQNSQARDQLIRVEFENGEMKNKLSSVVELKRAIKDLRIKARKEKQRASSGTSFFWFQAPRPAKAGKKAIEKPVEKPIIKKPLELEGNGGFLVKDGFSTFQKMIDIHVLPAEPTAQ
jgi:hypothetical protein